ncbi:MAG: terminase small subunit [Acidobacteriota bacterium]
MSYEDLTDKQRAFVDEYLVDFNGTQAAIRAGYSEKTAGSMAHENLKKPEIQAALAERIADRRERTEIDQDAIVRRLLTQSTLDVGELVSWGLKSVDGKPKPWVKVVPTEDIPKEYREAIETVEIGQGGSLKVKLGSKLKAMELLMRHLGMFRDKLEVSGGLDLIDPRDADAVRKLDDEDLLRATVRQLNGGG